MTREKLLNQIAAYIPYNEQEAADRELILHWIQDHDDAFTRQNQVAHITASAWVVNRDRRKVLLVYHNIYNSWSWLGGHADGETDLLAVALREVKEEAGIANVRPVSPDIYSLESLTVDGHVKKGQYVSDVYKRQDLRFQAAVVADHPGKHVGALGFLLRGDFYGRFRLRLGFFFWQIAVQFLYQIARHIVSKISSAFSIMA